MGKIENFSRMFKNKDLYAFLGKNLKFKKFEKITKNAKNACFGTFLHFFGKKCIFWVWVPKSF